MYYCNFWEESSKYGPTCPFAQFGKICITTDHSKLIKGKLSNCGKQCLFLGYPENHARGTYCLFILKSGDQSNYFLKRSIFPQEKSWKMGSNPDAGYHGCKR